ncbi:MAG TPA: hypothetical protein VHM25_02905, partial [Polyangiaceae bacterium]|nr:hypothetical protein [Polyangiaceae bacterium]
MKPRHRALSASFAILAGVCCPRLATAADGACPGVNIEADAGFRARFSDLLERIQSELATRSDLDACARITLHVDGDSLITMSVRLLDGRTTSRSVTRADDVAPTLQALLLVPLPSRSGPTLSQAPAPKPPRPAPPRALPASYDRDASPPGSGARKLGFELSFLTGARAGDGQIGVGAGALSFLEVYGWLLGFEGRADSYRAMLGSGDPETALELAILAGRRFHFNGWALDLTAGPAVAMKGLAVSETEVVAANMMNTVPPAPARHTDPSSGPVPRLLLGARFGFSPRSVFRTFVGVDGELGPGRVADEAE